MRALIPMDVREQIHNLKAENLKLKEVVTELEKVICDLQDELIMCHRTMGMQSKEIPEEKKH